MQILTNELLNDLSARLEKAIIAAEKFKNLDEKTLNFKKNADAWSILECLEHLNLYGDFYLPEIQKQINSSKYPANAMFKSGWLGNYFANMMLIDKNGIKKMKTPKDKNPANSALHAATIDRFLAQITTLKSLLTQAENVDLSKTKTGISLAPFISIRLGDTLRFVIYHIERHILQAENCVR